MNYQEFRSVLYRQKVFSTLDIAKEWPGFNFVNLVNWQDKGYLLKLRNKWYTFPDALNGEADLFTIANRLHRPSYISLETAMRYYNWIPESVFSITSVTTAKPGEWHTPVGHFSYRSIQPRYFFGYLPVEGKDCTFSIADPEKTLLDWLYFHPNLRNVPDFESWRLHNDEIKSQIQIDRIEAYLSLFASPALVKRWTSLRKFLEL